MPPGPTNTIYEAWQSTLAPFLVPACVLSAWPVFMILFTPNKTPLKLLGIIGLASLADGLLGSAAFPLAHQYAFTPTQNDLLFYAGSASYWLSGLLLGPLMEMAGTRTSAVALSLLGLASAVASAQYTFLIVVLGRAGSAAATVALTTLVEYALYDEARLRIPDASRSCGGGHGSSAPARSSAAVGGAGGASRAVEEEEEASLRKDHTARESADGQGGGMLTMFHQLRTLMLWMSMLLGQYAMSWTPQLSTGPCYVAAGCYAAVFVIAWRLLPTRGWAEAHKSNSRWKEVPDKTAGGEVASYLPGLVVATANASTATTPAAMVRQYLRCATSSYAVSLRTLLRRTLVARHLVDVFFHALFFVLSLLWVPTLEMYDDSIPFGFIFQLFMMASFLGITFSLPVWAVGWAEASLVVLLSITARVLNTSRDYAIPVTIMFAGVMMHFVCGVAQVTGSLGRAEYPAGTMRLTMLFVMKAASGVVGYVLLNVVDGKYMEDVFVFEARWVYALMWVQAVALAQYIVRRAAQHRENTHAMSSVNVTVNHTMGAVNTSNNSSSGVNNTLHPTNNGATAGAGANSTVTRVTVRAPKEDGVRVESSIYDGPPLLNVESELHVRRTSGNSSTNVSEPRVFKSTG